jgi:hypothetical protein
MAYGLGQREGDGTVTSIYKMNVPGDEVAKKYLDALFAPVNADDPLTGQGMQKEAFFFRYFTPKRMATGDNSFPYKDTTMTWFGRSTGCVEQP